MKLSLYFLTILSLIVGPLYAMDKKNPDYSRYCPEPIIDPVDSALALQGSMRPDYTRTFNNKLILYDFLFNDDYVTQEGIRIMREKRSDTSKIVAHHYSSVQKSALEILKELKITEDKEK